MEAPAGLAGWTGAGFTCGSPFPLIQQECKEDDPQAVSAYSSEWDWTGSQSKANICWLITNPEREGWWRGETPGKLVSTAKTFLSRDHKTVSIRSGFQQETHTHLSLKGTFSMTVFRGDEGEELMGHVPGVPKSQHQPCPTCCTALTEAGELYGPRTLYRQGEKSRRILEIKTFRVSYPNRNNTLNFGSIIAFGRITLVALQFFVQVSCSFIFVWVFLFLNVKKKGGELLLKIYFATVLESSKNNVFNDLGWKIEEWQWDGRVKGDTKMNFCF